MPKIVYDNQGIFDGSVGWDPFNWDGYIHVHEKHRHSPKRFLIIFHESFHWILRWIEYVSGRYIFVQGVDLLWDKIWYGTIMAETFKELIKEIFDWTVFEGTYKISGLNYKLNWFLFSLKYRYWHWRGWA